MKKPLKVKRSVKLKRNRKTYGQGRLAMKRSMKGLFVILAIVVSLVALQAVWAEKGPDCNTSVSGEVSDVLLDDNAIEVDGETVYGIPLKWVTIEVGDSVGIIAHECPDTGRLMACYLTVNDGQIIELRPRTLK
jgi:hypothetical protein